ncbi:UDP-glucuronosyl/UDP-glucosyltransferase [Dillenia turbinata]|uniref:UDP-glucuronosyl/UDP-glucosyltransferase n=1 Tax=Dillenia turbinata TaxID=194707 RepID=A0AAN8W9M3_9MAGN
MQMPYKDGLLLFPRIPFMFQSHLFLITDTASYKHRRGVTVTIIITPINVIRYKKRSTMQRIQTSKSTWSNSNSLAQKPDCPKDVKILILFPTWVCGTQTRHSFDGNPYYILLHSLVLIRNLRNKLMQLSSPTNGRDWFRFRSIKPSFYVDNKRSQLFPRIRKIDIRGGTKREGTRKWVIIRGWEPQVLILSHSAVGGFLTHRLELGAGRRERQLANDNMASWGEKKKIGVAMKREDIKKAIVRLSDEGEEGEKRRTRATELGGKANMAMEKERDPPLPVTLKKLQKESAMASDINQPHFVLIPLMAQGHMIPMIDMARLLAEHGVLVSLVTTPQNASRFQSTIQRANESGFSIRLVQIPFPCKDVGLPLGCENLDSVPSKNLIRKFYIAIDKLQQPLEKYLEENKPSPSCIISDKYLYWTSLTAKKFHVPRLVFHGMGCFSLLSSHNVRLYKAHHSVSSDRDPFDIPGLPHKIQITKAQLPGEFVKSQDFDDIRELIREAETSAYGVVLNSFDSLEHCCIAEYTRVLNKVVWPIGPVSLCNKKSADKFERGNKASIDEEQCLQWLDSKKQRSVVYICLGSQCRLVLTQIIELGLGLKASKHPFIWVIKKGERFSDFESWLEKESFEDRIKGRGLVIKGWAPQILILSHPAIGGFLSHCGWNSTIEAVCSGVPMLTWPMFAEQFLNEKLITEVLNIGIRIGVEGPVRWGDEEKVGILVTKSEVEIAVNRLMDGREGEMLRQRARELGEKARRAMEAGGTSNFNMSLMIQEIMNLNAQDKSHKQGQEKGAASVIQMISTMQF